MKVPERLLGFIDIEHIRYPFELDTDSFTLNLYPPTEEIWKQTSSIMGLIPIINSNTKKHEWIGSLIVEGISSNGNKLLFCLQDSRINYHGFYSYRIIWYFYFYDSMTPDRIHGFKITADEINYFFNPIQALESTYYFSSDYTKLEKIKVESVEQITESCGKYRIVPHIDAQVNVTCYATAHTKNFCNPIDATSELITEFSSPVSIDVVLDAYRYTHRFLQYIVYRKNIVIPSISLYNLDENEKKHYNGILVFGNSPQKENNPKMKDAIITYHLLRHRTSRILTNIKNGKLGLKHLCESIDDTTHYPSSRIIMILAEFEREYRNIYGTDSGRSQEYISTKNEIVELIDKYVQEHQGKKKTYAKQLKKYVQNRDSSFEANLKKALTDHEEIMKPFIKKKYDGLYSEIIKSISERMGEVRNGIAHSRLDLQFDAVHLCDIKIVEELIYAIRLKHCHLNKVEIQKSINNIFRENFAI